MKIKLNPAPEQLMLYGFLLLFVIIALGLDSDFDPFSEFFDNRETIFATTQGPISQIPMAEPVPLMTVPPQQQVTPIIPVNQVARQFFTRPCPSVTASPVAMQVPMTTSSQPLQCPPVVTSPTAAPITDATSPQIKMLPFQEAHWQGIEVVTLTKALRKVLKIYPDAQGVVADDVTPPADTQGFQAGDLIVSVGQLSTPTLQSFITATDRVRGRRRIEVQVLRKGQLQSLVLAAAQKRLGVANGEAAPMIKAGSRAPHGYKGPCTNCHRIGTTGQLAVDPGDLIAKKAPPISVGQKRPHRDRGECSACHKII